MASRPGRRCAHPTGSCSDNPDVAVDRTSIFSGFPLKSPFFAVAAHGPTDSKAAARRRGVTKLSSGEETARRRQAKHQVKLLFQFRPIAGILGQLVQGFAHALGIARTRPAERQQSPQGCCCTCNADHRSSSVCTTRRPRPAPSSRGKTDRFVAWPSINLIAASVPNQTSTTHCLPNTPPHPEADGRRPQKRRAFPTRPESHPHMVLSLKHILPTMGYT